MAHIPTARPRVSSLFGFSFLPIPVQRRPCFHACFILLSLISPHFEAFRTLQTDAAFRSCVPLRLKPVAHVGHTSFSSTTVFCVTSCLCRDIPCSFSFAPPNRKYSSTSFQSKTYDVVYAMPWNFVLERVQGGKKYPMIETEHMFIVDRFVNTFAFWYYIYKKKG